MKVYGKVFLAPLTEFTTFSFRELCRRYGADYTVVPLVNTTALARNPEKELDIGENESAGVQLFGKSAEEIKIAIKILEERFPDIIWFDLNCGCPSPRIRNTDAGSALLEKPRKITEIVSAMKASSSLPISVKIRIADNTEKTIDICRQIEKAGADFVIVHGKTHEDKPSEQADWGGIAKVRESLSIPVIGNGGVESKSHGMSMVKKEKADGFMVGRAAIRNPLLFRDKKPQNFDETLSLFMEYFKITEESGLKRTATIRLIAMQMFRNLRGSVTLRDKLSAAKTPEDLLSTLKSFSLENNQ